MKKFNSGYKNIEDQARSGRFKTVDSEAVFQTICCIAEKYNNADVQKYNIFFTFY